MRSLMNKLDEQALSFFDNESAKSTAKGLRTAALCRCFQLHAPRHRINTKNWAPANIGPGPTTPTNNPF